MATTDPDKDADTDTIAVGSTVTWQGANGATVTGKVVKTVTTGTLRPPVGPAIPAPAVLVQVGPRQLALPASKVKLAGDTDSDATTASADRPFGGLAPTVTLHDVELCRVGTWQASTGVAPISAEDLQSILDAARDPEIDHAPAHPGHIDARFAAVNDGEPAMGWVKPTRVEGDRLIGDLQDVPAKMAAIIPKAYRRRSVELAYNVKTPSGKKYATVLTGLGMLGVQAPAVKGLADVANRYSVGETEYELVELAVGEDVASFSADTPTEPDTSPSSQSQSAHDSSQNVDPAATGGSKVEYTDDQLRQRLGFEADVDMTPFQEALKSVGKPADAVAASEGGKPEAKPEAKPDAKPEAPAAAALSELKLPEGVVLLTQGQLDELTAKATAGNSAAEQLAAQRRDNIIASALSEGRLAPAEADTWRKELDENESRTVTLLSALTPSRVPVSPQGHGQNGSVDEAADKEQDDAFAAFSARTFGLPVASAN